MLLCIAAALVNQATTRRVPDRHRAVLQAFAFLQEYSKHRKNPQASALEAAKRGWVLGWLDARTGARGRTGAMLAFPLMRPVWGFIGATGLHV